MRKKILCAIVSAVMVVGTLVGCGSSSGGKAESTILTELTPGVSTKDDVTSYLDEHKITYEEDEDGSSLEATNTDTILGHEYRLRTSCFGTEDNTIIDDDALRWMEFKVEFKDVEDYKQGVDEFEDYITKLSTGVTYTKKKDGVTKEYYLIDDKDYPVVMYIEPRTYEDMEDGYYNTILIIGYEINNNYSSFKWKDTKGNDYTLKCIGNNTSSTED